MLWKVEKITILRAVPIAWWPYSTFSNEVQLLQDVLFICYVNVQSENKRCLSKIAEEDRVIVAYICAADLK